MAKTFIEQNARVKRCYLSKPKTGSQVHVRPMRDSKLQVPVQSSFLKQAPVGRVVSTACEDSVMFIPLGEQRSNPTSSLFMVKVQSGLQTFSSVHTADGLLANFPPLKRTCSLILRHASFLLP